MNSTSTNQILSVKHDVTLITENKIKTLALDIADQQVTRVGPINDGKHNCLHNDASYDYKNIGHLLLWAV